jgi:membrane fusion protein, multidrug efflux system
MSTIPTAQSPPGGDSHPAASAASSPPTGRRARFRPGPLLALAAVVALVALGVAPAIGWVEYRRNHSITDDSFVEGHIVNIAPELVSGRLLRYLVEENDRVVQGQVMVEIDPTPYSDKVNISRAQFDSAQADLARERVDLERVRKEVPMQIEVARRTFATSAADQAKAESTLKLTRDETAKDVDEARAGVKAAKASLTLAELEYTRFTRLEQQGASTLQRQQQVSQSRDSAQAQVDLYEAKLAKALASLTQIDVAQRTLEASEKSALKAAKGIEIADLGNDQIRELELLIKVKEQTVEQARRGLEAAQHDLEYTQVRAPFPGVVVKRYRHLGDFASAGVAILSIYNPELLYVEANLEETRLPGVAPGNPVRIEIDAFPQPFRGRVIWINKSTGAQFALMPRNVVSGEFTKVVQRVPVRIAIERDDRWPQLRAGLSARVAIEHGTGDLNWAEQEARRLAEIETRFNHAALESAPGGRETR